MDLNLAYYQNFIADSPEVVPEWRTPTFSGVSDVRLWEEFQAGSEAAYSAIYKNNVLLLYSYGLKLVKDKEMIKDCIQDLFLDIWKTKHRLGRVKSIKSYLFKSIRRKLIAESVRRRKVSKKFAISSIFLKSTATPSIESDIVERQHLGQQMGKLNAALDKLTDRQKEIIHLRYYVGLDYNEIAEIMSLSAKGAYKLMGRSIKALRIYMDGIS